MLKTTYFISAERLQVVDVDVMLLETLAWCKMKIPSNLTESRKLKSLKKIKLSVDTTTNLVHRKGRI